MSTLLDLLEDSDSTTAAVSPPPAVVEASVVPAVVNTGHLLTREEQIDSALREMETSILQKALGQIGAGMDWAKVAPELGTEEEVPEEFRKLHGDQALEYYRIARASLLSSKEAPVALKQNVAVATGIIKARAHEKSGPKILNMNLVEMPLVQINFPETEVKDRK